MNLSFSKMNHGTTVQCAASHGPQNKAHCRLTCPWEPATQRSKSNNHLNPPGTPLLLEYPCTVLLALSVPTVGFFHQSVILGIFPFALRSLTCLKGSFLPFFVLLFTFYITRVTPSEPRPQWWESLLI